MTSGYLTCMYPDILLRESDLTTRWACMELRIGNDN